MTQNRRTTDRRRTTRQPTRRRAGLGLGAASLALLAVMVGSERARTGSADAPHAAAAATLPHLTSALGLQPSPAPQVAEWDLPNLDHERVDYWIRRYQSDKRQDLETYVARMGRYASMITGELTRREMPRDLIYLAMIESGFRPKAASGAGASGLWQFVSRTARHYDLDINRAVDERNDPVKATGAAIEYLSHLRQKFGSWYLAAAAYNVGETKLRRVMRQQLGRTHGTDEDYYRIAGRLPQETRDYVPRMIAAARIVKDPEKYGFGEMKPRDPLAWKEVVAKPATPLTRLAKSTGTTVADIKELNPHLKLNRTRNDKPMVVRVPAPAMEPVMAD